MYVSRHVIFGAIFSLILFWIYPEIGILNTSIVFLTSVLIDADHYLYYVYKKKDWSLKNAYSWYIELSKKIMSLSRKERNKLYLGVYIFHGIEVLFVLFLLGLIVHNIFIFAFIGVGFHMVLDMVHGSLYCDSGIKLSLIRDFLKKGRGEIIKV